MAGWQDGTISTNGIQLHYTRTGGGGVPMVMVHGLTGNRLDWSRLAHALEPTYDMVLIDARGHGLSDKPETGYAPVDHMRDLAGAIEVLHLDRPIVIGHSMGAVTASMVAAECPELVRTLILEDPVWRWPTASDVNAIEKRNVYEHWRMRLELRKMLTTAESYSRGPRERPLWSAEDHEADVQAKEQVSMHVLEYILDQEQTWAQQAVKIQAPTLLIYGNPALGSIVGPDVAAEARRINPSIQPVQIPTAGHNIRKEQFKEYLAVLREYLARVQH